MISLKRLCYLALALSCACSDDDEKSVSLIEDEINNTPGWIYSSTANHAGNIDDAEFSSPDYSLKINALDTQADGFSFWMYNLKSTSFPEGAKLTLTAKVKTANLTNDGAFVGLRCDQDSQVLTFETTQGKIVINGTSEFKEYTVEISAIPKNTNSIKVFLVMSGNGTGTAYFDDVSLAYKK